MPPCPPSLGLGLSLARTRRGGVSLDPDAVAYIDAVIAAGGTLYDSAAATKQLASDYFTALKTDSTGNLHALLGRDYHPVWQVAAANAICAKSLTSGTFVGTVTHGVGFVQGDGSTGYMNTNVTPAALGLTPASAYLCVLAKTNLDGYAAFGARNNINTEWLRLLQFFGSLSFICMSSAITVGASVTGTGFLTGSRASGSRFLARRITASRTNLNSITDDDVGTTPPVNLFCMANNNIGTPQNHAANQNARFVIGQGMTDTQDAAFTLISKQFYEALTGIAIP